MLDAKPPRRHATVTTYAGPIRGVARGIYDGPHATPPQADSGPVFLGIKNITPDGRLDLSEVRHVSEEHYPRWIRRVEPRPDDIVFSYEATLHRYAIIPEGFRGCLGRRLGLIRPNADRVIPRFLHYYLLSANWRSVVEAHVVNGATVDRIPILRFPEFQIQVPDLDTQRSVVSALATYDDLIENNRRRIRLLEQAARLIYKEWFVQLRFPGHDHVIFTGGAPTTWRRKTIGEVCPLRYGKALKKGDRRSGSYPVFGSSGIVGNHDMGMVAGPGIIVGRKGNVGSVFWSGSDFWPIDTVYYIDSRHCTAYIYYALLHTQFLNTDVAVPGLNRDFAHSRQLLIPDDGTYTLFEQQILLLHRQIDQLARQNRALARARDMLLPRLMSGELEP